jgi:hypothetical protein
LGIATNRETEWSSHGKTGEAHPVFQTNDAVSNGGLLFLVPALLEQGLLKAGGFLPLAPDPLLWSASYRYDPGLHGPGTDQKPRTTQAM